MQSPAITRVLRDVFKLEGGFRGLQGPIVAAALEPSHVFASLPTGAGKSLCYQVPALVDPGLTVVFSPLLALMSDQVAGLQSRGVAVAQISSAMPWRANSALIGALKRSAQPGGPALPAKVLFVTPERLAASSGAFLRDLEALNAAGLVSRFVIDEAHVVSQWGLDFRPDYRGLQALAELFPRVPKMCLTATATPRVREDVVSLLGLDSGPLPLKVFQESFNRPNIRYSVVPKSGNMADSAKEVIKLVTKKYAGDTGIVYCLSTAECDAVASMMNAVGVRACSYHAKLSIAERDRALREWKDGTIHVVVSTVAFGMGIDKAGVRFVIHHTIPMSLEGLHQESGRAGRDGHPADAVVMYSRSDRARIERVQAGGADAPFNAAFPTGGASEARKEALDSVVAYCESTGVCRRVLLCGHFAEEFDPKLCAPHTCDVCDDTTKERSAMERHADKKKRAARVRRTGRFVEDDEEDEGGGDDPDVPWYEDASESPASKRAPAAAAAATTTTTQPQPQTPKVGLAIPAPAPKIPGGALAAAIAAGEKSVRDVPTILSKQAIRKVDNRRPVSEMELAEITGVGPQRARLLRNAILPLFK
jgi:bloom syndrome protein